MQITVKTAKKLTEGTNQYGAWVLYKIEAVDGKIYTTMAKGAENLTPGTVFEPADIILGDEREGVQEFKFKKFTLVTAGTSAPEKTANGKPDMSKEDWSEKDRLERWSRECNTCFMGIMEFAASGNITLSDDLDSFHGVYEAALAWALKHFNGVPAPAPRYKEKDGVITVEKPATTANEDFDNLASGSLEFKDAGEFAARVKKDLDINPSGIRIGLGVKEIAEIKDYTAAYAKLKAAKANTEGKQETG